MCPCATVTVRLVANLAPLCKSFAAPAGFYSQCCRSENCLLALMGCGVFSKGVTVFLLHVLVVKRKVSHLMLGAAGEMGLPTSLPSSLASFLPPFLPSFHPLLQPDWLSEQCAEAGALGPAGCLKEGCSTAHQAELGVGSGVTFHRTANKNF